MPCRSSNGVGAVQRRSPASSAQRPAPNVGAAPTAAVADGTSPAARTGTSRAGAPPRAGSVA
jgi:hypothetical protein